MTAYKCSLLSEYRSTLMGIAILGVMLFHSVPWSGNFMNLEHIIYSFARLIFTEGFLFLSGLGLYYSYTHQPNTYVFYKKRIMRLLVPFMLIALPYFLISLLGGEDNICVFVLRETALYYFFYGNDGMWYISISILLYFLFPAIYKSIFLSPNQKRKNGYFNLILWLAISVLLNFTLMYNFENYYERVSIGISKIPIFMIGIVAGYLSYNNRVFNCRHLILVVLITLFFYVLKKKTNTTECYYEYMVRICGMIVITSIIYKFKNKKVTVKTKKIFDWLGRYSLELYIIHMLNFHLLHNIVYTWMNLSKSSDIDVTITVLNLIFSFAAAPLASKITDNIILKVSKTFV